MQPLNFNYLIVYAWAKALEATVSESGRQLHTPKLPTIEFPPSWRSNIDFPVKVLSFTAKGFRSNITKK